MKKRKKTTELNIPLRQKNVLKHVVETYIKKPDAVGSKLLQESNFQDFSSATIRNDLAALEGLGFLTKEHPSSGRLPTKKGYQYYVDHFLHKNDQYWEESMFAQVRSRMEKIFANRREVIDQTIEQTAKIITNFLELPVVVTLTGDNNEILRKIDIVNISATRFMIYIITSYSNFLKYYIEIENQNQVQDIQSCIRIFNEGLIDVPISRVKERIRELTAKIRQSVHEYEFVFQKIIIRIIKELEKNVTTVKRNIYNVKSLISKPEVQNHHIDLKEVMDFLENNSIFKQLTFNYQKTGKTLINFNNVVEGIAVASTEIKDGGMKHKISVVGPTRMDYKLVKHILEFVHEKLSEKK